MSQLDKIWKFQQLTRLYYSIEDRWVSNEAEEGSLEFHATKLKQLVGDQMHKCEEDVGRGLAILEAVRAKTG